VGSQSVTLGLSPAQFPYFVSNLDLKAKGATVFVLPVGSEPVDTAELEFRLGSAKSGTWASVADTAVESAPVSASGALTKSWELTVSGGRVDRTEVADILLLFGYTATEA
jgi:hypothetical protein